MVDPVNAGGYLSEAAFSGASPRSIMDVLKMQQQKEMERRNAILQQRMQSMKNAALREQMANQRAMQTPELYAKLYSADRQAERPDAMGWWNLMKAKEMGQNKLGVQEMRGTQAQALQTQKGAQRKEEIALTGEQRMALQELKGKTLKEIQAIIQSGGLGRLNAGKAWDMAIQDMVYQKRLEEQRDRQGWKSGENTQDRELKRGMQEALFGQQRDLQENKFGHEGDMLQRKQVFSGDQNQRNRDLRQNMQRDLFGQQRELQENKFSQEDKILDKRQEFKSNYQRAEIEAKEGLQNIKDVAERQRLQERLNAARDNLLTNWDYKTNSQQAEQEFKRALADINIAARQKEVETTERGKTERKMLDLSNKNDVQKQMERVKTNNQVYWTTYSDVAKKYPKASAVQLDQMTRFAIVYAQNQGPLPPARGEEVPVPEKKVETQPEKPKSPWYLWGDWTP